MKKDVLTGTTIPRFQYDTPNRPGCDFYALCAGPQPLVLVFLPNFGHPLSREFLKRYLQSFGQLQSGRLACVVRSAPQRIAQLLAGAEFPFALICDAEGVLYDLFEVKTTRSVLDWTPLAGRVFREAKQNGYTPQRGEAQLLPLTLVVGEGGRVLYAHHGKSLTDLPEDCAAVERVCALLEAQTDAPAVGAEPAAPAAAQADAGELLPDSDEPDTLQPADAETAAEDTAPAAQAAEETTAQPD